MSEIRESARRFLSLLAIGGFEDTVYNYNRLDSNAKQVLESMESLVEKMKPMKLRKGIYYRARVVETKDICTEKGFSTNVDGRVCAGYNETESGRAPECIVKAGRINREWEAIWYIADDAYTAMAEVRPGVREQVSVAEYRIVNNEDLYILDFSGITPEMKKKSDSEDLLQNNHDLHEIYVEMQKLLTLPAVHERSYFISNMIADIIKGVGVSGVKYKSFYGKGTNIALWDIDEKEIEYYGSTVYLNYCSNQAFISLEDGKTIKNTSFFNTQLRTGSFDAIEDAQKMYRELINRIRR